jgi:hypothetical protein
MHVLIVYCFNSWKCFISFNCKFVEKCSSLRGHHYSCFCPIADQSSALIAIQSLLSKIDSATLQFLQLELLLQDICKIQESKIAVCTLKYFETKVPTFNRKVWISSLKRILTDSRHRTNAINLHIIKTSVYHRLEIIAGTALDCNWLLFFDGSI